jgi:hypothetical protein
MFMKKNKSPAVINIGSLVLGGGFPLPMGAFCLVKISEFIGTVNGAQQDLYINDVDEDTPIWDMTVNANTLVVQGAWANFNPPIQATLTSLDNAFSFPGAPTAPNPMNPLRWAVIFSRPASPPPAGSYAVLLQATFNPPTGYNGPLPMDSTIIHIQI